MGPSSICRSHGMLIPSTRCETFTGWAAEMTTTSRPLHMLVLGQKGAA